MVKGPWQTRYSYLLQDNHTSNMSIFCHFRLGPTWNFRNHQCLSPDIACLATRVYSPVRYVRTTRPQFHPRLVTLPDLAHSPNTYNVLVFWAIDVRILTHQVGADYEYRPSPFFLMIGPNCVWPIIIIYPSWTAFWKNIFLKPFYSCRYGICFYMLKVNWAKPFNSMLCHVARQITMPCSRTIWFQFVKKTRDR